MSKKMNKFKEVLRIFSPEERLWANALETVKDSIRQKEEQLIIEKAFFKLCEVKLVELRNKKN